MNPSAYPPPPVQFQHQMPQGMPMTGPPPPQQYAQQQQGPPAVGQQQQMPPPQQYAPQHQSDSSATWQNTGHQQQSQLFAPPPPQSQMAGQSHANAPSAATINGNYQEELVATVNSMDINSAKAPLQQQHQAPLPPPNFANSNSNGSMAFYASADGSSSASPSVPNAEQRQPTGLTANNNYFGSKVEMPNPGSNQSAPNFPPPLPENSTAGGRPPTVAGGVNQMSTKGASLSGLPHMPPQVRSATSSPYPPPLGGQNEPALPAEGKLSTYGQFTPQQDQRQPPNQQQQYRYPPGSAPGHPYPQSAQQQLPGIPPVQQPAGQYPGMPPLPQTAAHQAQSIKPPMPQQLTGSLQPGIPPMQQQLAGPPQSGMPPMHQQLTGIQQPGLPPMPQQSGIPQQSNHPSGFPPLSHGIAPQYGSQFPPQSGGQQHGAQNPPGFGQPPMQNTYPGQMLPSQNVGPTNFGQPAGPGGMYQPSYPQAPRRLDPDQMPSPVQVMEENQANFGGVFVTNQPGLVPPLVTTKFIVQDQGNSSPRYIRSSMYSVPCTADLLKSTALPFTLNISPMAKIAKDEYEPVLVDFGELGPIRCNRCKAYMSPNMQFIDAGRRFQCPLCKVTTEVPTEYFQHLDHTGQRMDKYERPELVLGTYEFVATADYCRNNVPCNVPAFVFVIDVSYNAFKSGLVHLICKEMKSILRQLPADQSENKSKLRVGFITFNSSVHFYNIKSSLAQPQMMVVGDVQDMFMPLLDGFLCHPEESEVIIDALMEQIPRMFADTKETEAVLYPAMQAGLEALKASNCAGKLFVFNTTLPIAQAPGQLKNREDRKLLGTDKEKTILTPQCTMYNQLGQEFVQNGCSADLFVFNNSYIDIATIGQVSRLTGGEVYKYTYFQAELDGNRFIEELKKNISRQIAFDAVMRVRTSAGIRPTDFYGHFYMANTTDIELASVDSSKSISIEIKHDDKLVPEENVYVQVALLYTSCGGQRRLRVLNLALRATNTYADIFKGCDVDALVLFFAKQACFKLMDLTPKQVKDNLINRSAQILACYRKHCTSPASSGQLILPEGLKLLPLYVSCLLKNDAISGGSDMTLDDRSFAIQFVLSMDLNTSVVYFYPRLIPIHDVDPNENDIPPPVRCTHERMSENGAYILENGVHFFVWLGQALPPSFIQPLFGVQHTQQVNPERFAIVGDTPLAQRIKGIINNIMAERTRTMRITCVRQNDKLESVFRHFLVEDRGTDGTVSYIDFLCHLHKEIKEILS